MQEFTSDAGRHGFKFDGRQFYVPSPKISDVATITALADVSTAEQAEAMSAILTSKAVPEKLTLWEWLTGKNPVPAVIESLGLVQSGELFKAWMAGSTGQKPGESSGSAN